MISIIIVTRNRIGLLLQCMDSLIGQIGNKHEIIIVDNHSSDNTCDMIKNKYGGKVRLISADFEKSLGSCKNMGINEARGGIIAFTDDDCVPSGNWLERILVNFENRDCDLTAGPVRLLNELRFPWWWRQSLNWTIGIAEIKEKKFLPLGSNVAFKKDALLSLISGSGSIAYTYTEDSLKITEALKKGYKIKLDEEMIVYHNAGKERLALSRLIKRGWLEGKHWAKNRAKIKILACRLIAIIVNPFRFILTLDINHILRMVVSISYAIECVRRKTRYLRKGRDILNFFNYSFSPRKPAVVCIDITSRCNLKCSFCEIGSGIKNDFSKELTKKELFGIIDQLKKWKINKIDAISGGEPFIREDFWEFLEYCAHNHVRINTVCTNGTLLAGLDNKKFEMLSSSVSGLSVSLDSSEENAHDFFRGKTQVYAQVMTGLENIQRLKKETGLKLNIATSSVVNKRNHQDISNIIILAKKIGAGYAIFQPINHMPNFYGVPPAPEKKNFIFTERDELEKLKESIKRGILTGRKNNMKNNLMVFSKWAIPYFEQTIDSNKNRGYFFGGIYKHFTCFVPFSHLKINSEGFILPCYLLPEVNNIRKTGIKTSWLHDIIPARKHLKSGKFFEQCKACYCDFPYSLQYNLSWYPFKKRLFFLNIFIYYIKKIILKLKGAYD